MTDSPIDEIKSRLPIIEVLGEYIQLKKAGINLKANCPFHKEKTPSFMVSPEKQIWHCFGCGLGGDIFEFVKQIEGVEFSQALRMLADKAGVELRKPSAGEIQLRDKKDLLKEINAAAAMYYSKVLWESNTGLEALNYLKRRGLTDQTIKQWGLGYSPDDYHFLENFLAKKYPRPDIEAAGLVIKKKDGTYFDRFRGRVMFPIMDAMGDVVGFTGRQLVEKEGSGKYVNTPETVVYQKSEILYGYNFAKNMIRRENRTIIVEGNMDVITAHQAGFTQVVASSGTALTVQQLQILSKACENLLFAFDSDEAGTNASQRALEAALGFGFNIKMIDLGQSKDPDDLIRKGIGIWQKAVDSAPYFIDYFLEKLSKQNDPGSVDGKRQISKIILPLIFRITDNITQAHFIRKLSAILNVVEPAVWDMLKKIKAPKPIIPSNVSDAVRKDRQAMLEDEVMGLCLMFNDNSQIIEFDVADFSEANRELGRALKMETNFDSSLFESKYPNLKDKIQLLSFSSQVRIQERGTNPKQDLEVAQKELVRLIAKKKMEALSGKMSQADKTGDKEALRMLTQEFNELAAKLSQIP
jgi:DNA primase